jgi:hypothetical protein
MTRCFGKVHEAAELAKLTPERIRQICKRHGVGKWEPRLRAFVVNRQRLMDHLARTKRRRYRRRRVEQRAITTG